MRFEKEVTTYVCLYDVICNSVANSRLFVCR